MKTRRERALAVAQTLTSLSVAQRYCVTERQAADLIEAFANDEVASDKERAERCRKETGLGELI